jgi:hypothetical protein
MCYPRQPDRDQDADHEARHDHQQGIGADGPQLIQREPQAQQDDARPEEVDGDDLCPDREPVGV